MSKIQVDYISHMGDDLTVVNAARVSFGKVKTVLDAKDIKLLDYLAKHKHHCYDDKTEVLTEDGWKLFKDLTPSDKVAAVSRDGDSFKFETPKDHYTSTYTGDMYKVESSQVDFCVTTEHRMFVSQRTSTGFKDFEVRKIQDIYTNNIKCKRNSSFKFKTEGGEEDFLKGKLIGFYLGDGFRYSPNFVAFRLKKERKITYLRDILTALKFPFMEVLDPRGVTNFKLKSGLLSEEVDISKTARDKCYELMKVSKSSKRFTEGLLDGLLNSDGTARDRGYDEYSFSSTSTSLLNLVDFCCVLLNKATSLTKGRGQRLNILNRVLQPRLNDSRLGDVNKVKKFTYTGNIYCVSVSTGLLMVRRNGIQLICGNTPYEHCTLSVLVKCPLYIRSQIHRHRTFSYNEISRRYTDQGLEIYLPDTYRLQHTTSKQCSAGDLDPALNAQLLAKTAQVHQICLDHYQELVDNGVAREQARGVLPQDLMTEFWMTGNLRNWVHFLSLRIDAHAQKEVRDIANPIKGIIEDKFPEAGKALLRYL